jgi:ABC-type glycerol-3-phosphate transport system substrate-binding protein
MNQQNRNRIALLLILALMLSACATGATVTLTPDQKARQAISAAQGQWDIWFDTAALYYAAKPDRKTEYQTKVLPAFQVALDINKTATNALRTGGSPDIIQEQVRQGINTLMLLLIQMGVIK